jgi:uncharacterized protein
VKAPAFINEESKRSRVQIPLRAPIILLGVMTIQRNESITLLKQHVTEPVLIKHCLAVGAIMRGIASEINENPELYENCGILHDVDFQTTKENPAEHGLLAQQILEGKIPQESLQAIKAHNHEHTGLPPNSKIDFALIASDALSGLVIAAALVRSDKKLSEVKPKSIAKRFKEKGFARACRRELILYCEKLGIERTRFFEIALTSLQSIHEELGL